MSLGVFVHTAFAAIGLSALLAHSAIAFSVVKYAGAGCLVYLGTRTLLSRENLAVSEEAAPMELRVVFFQAVISGVLNPKVALSFLAFLPQFVSSKAGSAALQMVLLRRDLRAARPDLTLHARLLFGYCAGNWLGRPSLANALR